MNKGLFWKNRLARVLAMSLIIAVGLITIIGTRNGNGPPPAHARPFVLAYVDIDSPSWRLRLRYSEDGVTWVTPSAGTPTADRAPGLADNNGMYLAVFQDGVSRTRYMVGLGAAAWDSQPSLVGNGHVGELDSGTSIAHMTGNDWLVGYVSQTAAKIRKFSTSTRDFVDNPVTPVLSVVNNNLIDKPAITIRYPTVVVSWLMQDQLQVVTGDVQSGTPVWQPGYLFSANVTEQGFGPPIGAHDLVHDGEKFYMGVIRHQIPPDVYDPGAVSQYFMFIYTSDDGLHWSKLTQRQTMNPHAMSIAARGTNDIIAILTHGTMYAPTNAYRFNGSSWSALDEQVIFGDHINNAGHDFTLYARP